MKTKQLVYLCVLQKFLKHCKKRKPRIHKASSHSGDPSMVRT